ncbi:MAG: hypothetical protein ACRDOI_02395 [Trebonia sp.]
MTASIVILQLAVLAVVLESDLGRRRIGWFRTARTPATPAAVSQAGLGYAVIWIAVTLARLGFAYGAQHLFPAELGQFLVSHQLSATALTPVERGDRRHALREQVHRQDSHQPDLRQDRQPRPPPGHRLRPPARDRRPRHQNGAWRPRAREPALPLARATDGLRDGRTRSEDKNQNPYSERVCGFVPPARRD